MGRELQKKKNRSSIPKIKIKNKSKSVKKRVNPLGNAIIAANWNKEETLTQNYRRLGLSSRLNSATGGIEKRSQSKSSTTNRLAISTAAPKEIAPTEARVERDPVTGKITKVIHAKKQSANPLNDPLNSDSEEEFGGFEDGEERGADNIVAQLEEQAQMIAEKKPRKQSQREQEWIERLVSKYGDDYAKMSRDMKLNPMQQTAPDIGRRVQKWRAEGATA